MTETSFEGDIEEGSTGSEDTSSAEPEGYAEPGGYTAPDGSTGYSGLQSGGEEPAEPSSEYEASVGALLAVGFIAGGLALDGVLAGFGAAETANVVGSVGWSARQAYGVVDIGVEMYDGFSGN